ncbi:MAG: MBL fold metallo-hydrolase, partial [Candidatus Aenigmarchaeota archaeon]|nr:MBL fold metallo-hydrolase [Candidatus Aenigmarchaeota archaeon]
MAEVYILREGDLQFREDDTIFAPATVTLVKYKPLDSDEDRYLLVDAGGLDDTVEDLDNWLPDGITHEDIYDVILTHNHPDHTGLVRFIGGEDGAMIYGPDSTYHNRDAIYSERSPEGQFGIDVYLLDTPGHESSKDRSVLVGTDNGRVAIVGDLMLNKEEFINMKDFSQWLPENERGAYFSRLHIHSELPDIYEIVPGHGPSFKPM